MVKREVPDAPDAPDAPVWFNAAGANGWQSGWQSGWEDGYRATLASKAEEQYDPNEKKRYGPEGPDAWD